MRKMRRSQPLQNTLLVLGVIGMIFSFVAMIGIQQLGRVHDTAVYTPRSSSAVSQNQGAVTRFPSGTRYITITKVPSGEAPFEVRKVWQGCTLPVMELRKGMMGSGVVTGQSDGPHDFYAVDPAKALQILQKKDPRIADWFDQRVPADTVLLFETNAGRLSDQKSDNEGFCV